MVHYLPLMRVRHIILFIPLFTCQSVPLQNVIIVVIINPTGTGILEYLFYCMLGKRFYCTFNLYGLFTTKNEFI